MKYKSEPYGVYFIIDNKSFYASCEALRRGLNPLLTPLVVMSEQVNTNGGLILATSPKAKKEFGLQANISRQRDLPQADDLIVAPPRMNLYIQKIWKLIIYFVGSLPMKICGHILLMNLF